MGRDRDQQIIDPSITFSGDVLMPIAAMGSCRILHFNAVHCPLPPVRTMAHRSSKCLMAAAAGDSIPMGRLSDGAATTGGGLLHGGNCILRRLQGRITLATSTSAVVGPSLACWRGGELRTPSPQ